MTKSDVHWVVAIQREDGAIEPYRLQPLNAPLEFCARDRDAAISALVTSGVHLPDEGFLLSRLEFDDLIRSSAKDSLTEMIARFRKAFPPKARKLMEAAKP